jgi:hypothetical protein
VRSEPRGHCSIDISDEELISDCESSLKQADILRMLATSTDSEVGFSKVRQNDVSICLCETLRGIHTENAIFFVVF